jgi:methionyl-tRNA formyltransferase
MKILFLGGGDLSKDLANWLKQHGEEVVYTEKKINLEDVLTIKPEFIVSYNYKYIISKEIINYVKGKAVNLHISYLPYNRGAHPNVWSFLEDTPKGVTIHYIDEGIDTGDILLQKEIFIDEEKETLKSSYNILHNEIQILFKENWQKIKEGKIESRKQIGKGSIHYKKDFILFEPLIMEKGWDTPIKELKEKWEQIKLEGMNESKN